MAKKTRKVRRPAVKTKKVAKMKAPKAVGKITHYYGGIKVAIVKFSKPVSIGAMLHYKGATTDFKKEVLGMQYNHKEVKRALKGKQMGIKVPKRVREGDEVFEIL